MYKSNRLLKLEQDKTRLLYSETLEVNRELKKAAKEAIIIKEEIQQKNEELNKSNATKDRFLGIIAHDLKNPIGAIWGISDLLMMDRNIDEKEKQHCIEAINSSVKHTHELLEDLLNWARAQNKSIVYEPIVHSACTVVEKELKVLKQIADKKSIQIINKIPENFEVYADSHMLETIVRNLVSNAIKYTYSNGSIIINANVIDMGNRNFAEIAIEDNGIGMSKEKVSKLFTLNQ